MRHRVVQPEADDVARALARRAPAGPGRGSPPACIRRWRAGESISVPSQSNTMQPSTSRQPFASTKLCISAGSGAERSFSVSSVSGWRSASRAACRNRRFTPCFASSRLSSKSPYLSSPSDRMAGVREVHADLVRAAGQQPDFEQAEVGAFLRATRTRVTASLPSSCTATRRSPWASTYLCSDSRSVARAASPGALDQREVDLVDLAVAQHAVQLDQRAALLGDEQHARGVAVEPVRQLEELRLRPRRRATTRSRRSSRRCRRAPPRPPACRSRGAPRLRTRPASSSRPCRWRLRCSATRTGGTRTRSPSWRRYSGFDAAAVDPHLAAAQHAVDVAFGHALQVAQQEVVDALRRAFFPDFQRRRPSLA